MMFMFHRVVRSIVLCAVASGTSMAFAVQQEAVDASIGEAISTTRDVRIEYLEANSMMKQVLRIVSDDETGSEIRAACTTVSEAAFGEGFDPGTSGVESAGQSLPLVFSASGASSIIADLRAMPLDPGHLPIVDLLPGFQAFVYSARFGAGPEHVGVACVVDRWLVGHAVGPDDPMRYGISFTPIDLLDASEPLAAEDVLEFMKGSAAGAFDAPGRMRAWMRSKSAGQDSTFLAAESLPRCDPNAVADCIAAVLAEGNSCFAGLQNLDRRIADLEAEIVGQSKGFVQRSVMVMQGPALGATAGAVAGAIIGSNVGVSLALRQDLDEVRSEMEHSFCSCVRRMVEGIRECILTHCPEMWSEYLEAQLEAELAQSGC